MPVLIDQNSIAEEDIHLGMRSEKVRDFGECSGQVLLIAVQISAEIASRTA